MMKKCTKQKRHKWSFIRNVTVKRIYFSGSIQLKLCGLFRCECGAKKYGLARFNLSDVTTEQQGGSND